MTTIKGNLVMDKDMEYEGDLIVKGNILGKNGNRYNLKVNGNIKAEDIDVEDITALNIRAFDIIAGDIKAKNLNTLDITALNITALDINAEDIKALNINARNIFYYAVCFAYGNIKCNSIKDRRKHARHFVLDGKIEVVE